MKNNRRAIYIFLFTTFALSAIFYFLIIHAGTLRTNSGLYVLGLMWCPAASALITSLVLKSKLNASSWRFGKLRYLIMSYLIPIAYSLIAYAIIWLTGWGNFYNENFVHQVAASYGWNQFSDSTIILFYILRTASLGMIVNSIAALGEEIGWRGFLVSELFKNLSYTKTSLVVGIVWAVWHFPLILFADYNTGTPVWYALLCFTTMVISLSFIYTWFRLRSHSVWTTVVLHATHNLFIQSIFTPLTNDTGTTRFFIDEFGAILPLTCMCFAIFFWNRRSQLKY